MAAAGASSDGDGPDIFAAALKGDLAAVKARISDRDSRTDKGFSPLALAVSAGHTDVVRVLLREGVSWKIRAFAPVEHARTSSGGCEGKSDVRKRVRGLCVPLRCAARALIFSCGCGCASRPVGPRWRRLRRAP